MGAFVRQMYRVLRWQTASGIVSMRKSATYAPQLAHFCRSRCGGQSRWGSGNPPYEKRAFSPTSVCCLPSSHMIVCKKSAECTLGQPTFFGGLEGEKRQKSKNFCSFRQNFPSFPPLFSLFFALIDPSERPKLGVATGCNATSPIAHALLFSHPPTGGWQHGQI